ncbi:MAG: hypothetical protein ABIS18_01925 [Actinomycetota bacterium]
MRRALAICLFAVLGVVLGSSALSAHTPIELDVIEPTQGQVLQSTTIRVSMRARSLDPALSSIQVQIKVDESWFDSQKGTLGAVPSAFGGLVISTGQTKQVTIENVRPGAHRLQVSYSAHVGEAPVIRVFDFEVAADAETSRKRGSTLFFVMAGTLVVGAGLLQLSWRRRMSRS